MGITAQKVRDSNGREAFCAGIFHDEARAGTLSSASFDVWDVPIKKGVCVFGDLLSSDWGSLLARYLLAREKLSLRLKVLAGSKGAVRTIETPEGEYREYEGKIYSRRK